MILALSALFGDDFLNGSSISFWNGNFFDKEDTLKDVPINKIMKLTVIPTYQITYMESSGFGAYVCEDENEKTLKISGEFPTELIVGQSYIVEGKVSVYKEEKQLKVFKIRNVRPVSKKGIISYLQTLKGLKNRAELIYREFGENSIKVLIENPMLVSKKVPGIGKKSVLSWKEQLDKLSESQETISTLLDWGLTLKESKKLYDKFKEDIVRKIESNPYFLASEVKGYGFDKCDKIAKEVGISPKSSFRIQEGLINILKNATMSGHCFLPYKDLVIEGTGILTIRLTYQEMISFAKQYSGKKHFEYYWGNPQRFNDISLFEEETNAFTIDYDKMMGCLNDYENENDSSKRDRCKYIACPISSEEVDRELQQIIQQGRVIYDEDRIYIKNLYFDEIAVADRVAEIAQTEIIFERDEIEEELNYILEEKGIILEDKQRTACIEFNLGKGGFDILCGSAGTGKTFILLIILEVKRRLYKKKLGRDISSNIMIFAPTGKASKVASKATGMNCITIHRGLGYIPAQGFSFNKDEPLKADVLVVDETSMLDISLARSLFEAISPGTQVILMGDRKQLPSVGPGAVLSDLIDSELINVIELDVIKRQKLISGIVKTANRIIEGKMIESSYDTNDSYFVTRSTISGCQRGIVDSIKKVLNFNKYSIEEIQVLVPQRTGSVGTYMLNYILQKEFNKENNGSKVLYTKFQARLNERVSGAEVFELNFMKNDKVIHIKNNYDMKLYNKSDSGEFIELEKTGITNGECGVIEDIINEPGGKNGEKNIKIIVRYEDFYVIYEDVEELEMAWALTIHKSQGSAWSCVILPMMTAYWNMLDRTLLYTGVTRAREFLAVVGSEKAVRKAIDTQKATKRYTALNERLCKARNSVA